MGYSFQLAARFLLYASSHRQDDTYHSLCYTSCDQLWSTGWTILSWKHTANVKLCLKILLVKNVIHFYSKSQWSLLLCPSLLQATIQISGLSSSQSEINPHQWVIFISYNYSPSNHNECLNLAAAIMPTMFATWHICNFNGNVLLWPLTTHTVSDCNHSSTSIKLLSSLIKYYTCIYHQWFYLIIYLHIPIKRIHLLLCLFWIHNCCNSFSIPRPSKAIIAVLFKQQNLNSAQLLKQKCWMYCLKSCILHFTLLLNQLLKWLNQWWTET